MPPVNCTIFGLTPLTAQSSISWNAKHIRHFYRRASFGASDSIISTALELDPSTAINTIIQEAINKPLSPPPDWADWALSDYGDNVTDQITEQVVGFATDWLDRLYEGNLRDKLTLFWHNHFVTQYDSYSCPSWMYQYYNVIERFALGNFKSFVREMGISPAMLVYLNGVQNTRFEPNENYARELYELFTLGLDNGYTQQDIAETARALTGYNDFTEACAPIGFRPLFHDDGEKTIFGRTGNWGYDDVIDILFEERGMEVATSICTKLYRYFVNPKLSEDIIEELATLMVNSNYELAPVISTLLASEHFFDEANHETIIPGHLEMFFTHSREQGIDINSELQFLIAGTAGDIGQRLLNPVDVAGWQGNREWINTNTLIVRWGGLQNLTNYFFTAVPEHFREMVITLTNDSNDPSFITRTIIDHFVTKGFEYDEEYDKAIIRFKSEIPENYYEDGSWNLHWDTAPNQIRLLLNYISTLPEYQLK